MAADYSVYVRPDTTTSQLGRQPTYPLAFDPIDSVMLSDMVTCRENCRE